MRLHQPLMCRFAGAAFTIIEVVFAMAVAGLMFVALYSGLMTGFTIIHLARENTRASQILVEKMETIRLYTWDQINSNGFIPTNFSVVYSTVGGTNNGAVYQGTLTITNVSFSTSYAADMKKVTVQLNWMTGNLARRRTASTYISRYGLQNYIY